VYMPPTHPVYTHHTHPVYTVTHPEVHPLYTLRLTPEESDTSAQEVNTGGERYLCAEV